MNNIRKVHQEIEPLLRFWCYIAVGIILLALLGLWGCDLIPARPKPAQAVILAADYTDEHAIQVIGRTDVPAGPGGFVFSVKVLAKVAHELIAIDAASGEAGVNCGGPLPRYNVPPGYEVRVACGGQRDARGAFTVTVKVKPVPARGVGSDTNEPKWITLNFTLVSE